MKTLIPIFILLLAVSFSAQQPDRWHGLVLDQSTPEQALKLFGVPKSDKTNPHLYLNNAKWFTKTAVRDMRILHYENIEGFHDVKLGFDLKSKLVLIHLEPNKITAQAFLASYPDLDFRYGNEVQSPSDFKRPRVNSDRPYKLDVVYLLVSVTDNAIIFGQAGNATGSVMSDLFGGGKERQAGRSVPGNVGVIQMVSRTLENRDGSNLLK
jgi:hypothetical protein